MESYNPAQIRDANLARAALGRKTDKTHRKISDERVPKRPSSAYSLFVKERWAAGGLEGAATQASAELAREWRALPDGEKKVSRCPPFVLDLRLVVGGELLTFMG